ncbi:MAG: efflux RND transporter periplasmic adaptor subunit [Patescibacteria group bacterium]|nr:efflux RND transporter periplasmic adaptor subunit [Patescibacteria group bacterium]
MQLKKYNKKVIIGSMAAILVVVVILIVRSGGSEFEYETYAVDRGEVVEVISATGSIAPSSKIKLQPQVMGKVVEIPVEEGDEVLKGDVLLQLDVGDINAQILAQRAALASAQAKLAQYESGATEQELAVAERSVETTRARLDASKVARNDAQEAYDNALSKADAQLQSTLGTFVSDLEDAAIAANDGLNRLTDRIYTSSGFPSFTVSNSQAQSDAVQTRIEAETSLSSIDSALMSVNGDASVDNVSAQYDAIRPHLQVIKGHLDVTVTMLNYAVGVDSTTLATYRLNANTALSALSAAMQALSNDDTSLELRIQLNDSDINTSLAALNATKNTVATNEGLLAEAEASLNLTRTGTRDEIISAQRALVSAERARLAGLQNDWEKRRITAPVDGIVTLIAAEPGESVLTSQTAVMMNAKGNLEVVANISEIDIAKLSIGDMVTIEVDAFTMGERWIGSVVAIQPAETVVDNVIFYETTIRFDGEDERLRSGMTADLDIETDRKDGVLRVPIRAVKPRNGDMYVELLTDRGIVEGRDVEVGLETDDFAEILSGIEEGDNVIVYTSEK